MGFNKLSLPLLVMTLLIVAGVQGNEISSKTMHSKTTPLVKDSLLASSSNNTGSVPTDNNLLFKYLTEKKYLSFKHRETKVHPSIGPHRHYGWPVLVYVSDNLYESLQANNAIHPVGSALIKEMYAKDGKSLVGWAVMVKTQKKNNDGDDWYWYEVGSTTDSTQHLGVTPENGAPICVSCHAGGNDYVLSKKPLF